MSRKYTIEEAVELLKTSNSVEEWNDHRDKIFAYYKLQEQPTPIDLVSKIDAEGLIAQTLYPKAYDNEGKFDIKLKRLHYPPVVAVSK